MRVQSPIVGQQSGTTAYMIFQSYGGRTYARSKPALYHYPGTPAQRAAQRKFYNIETQWLPIYRTLRNFFPQTNKLGLNYFNVLSTGIFAAAQTFPPIVHPEELHHFGIDIYDNITIDTGYYAVENIDGEYTIYLHDFSWQSQVDFRPINAHALLFCPDLQQIEYEWSKYTEPVIEWPFKLGNRWLPSHEVNLFVAFSDDNFFSNFFY